MKTNGIDVSLFQGNVDYAQVKNAGKDFCICKVSQGMLTKGTVFSPFKDSTFEANITNAYANGFKVGAYHYMMGTTVAEVEQEADFCISCLLPHKSKLYYPVFIDIEDKNKYCNDAYKDRNTELVLLFAKKLSKAGFIPGIATFNNFLHRYIDETRLGDIELFYAYYNVSEGTVLNDWPTTAIWQHGLAEVGDVPGINAKVDLDIAFVEFPRYNKLRLTDNAPCYIDYGRKQLVDVPSMTTPETLKSYFVTDSSMHMVTVTPSSEYVGTGTTVKLYSNDVLVDTLTVA